jgi:hypothetical protein
MGRTKLSASLLGARLTARPTALVSSQPETLAESRALLRALRELSGCRGPSKLMQPSRRSPRTTTNPEVTN